MPHPRQKTCGWPAQPWLGVYLQLTEDCYPKQFDHAHLTSATFLVGRYCITGIQNVIHTSPLNPTTAPRMDVKCTSPVFCECKKQ